LVGVRTGAGEGCVSGGDEEANETAASALASANSDGEGYASDDGDPEIGSDDGDPETGSDGERESENDGARETCEGFRVRF
jgi:hypothetical protein